MAFVYAWIVPLWADQLLPQLLMEPFDTSSLIGTIVNIWEVFHMTIMLFSEIAYVINNVMTTGVLTPAQLPIVINRITIHIITLVNGSQDDVNDLD